MKKEDKATQITNARLISCVYFCLLAIVATIFIDLFLYLVGVEELIPTFWAVILAAVIAAVFGALFGKKIIHVEREHIKRSFLWGFLMVIIAMPVYDLGFFILVQSVHPESFIGASVLDLIALYGILFVYSFVLVGFWLAIIAGFAAMYLRSKLVYYILDSDEKELSEHIKTDTKTTKP